jgi:DNA-binding MurR/RpiR family transcriptional regulator
MSALNRMRVERAQLSAIERRIADYILDNAPLIRDYSSQQLADTLKVSQSSVVKFAQRLGYKGYPDLKLSIAEALALATAGSGDVAAPAPPPADADTARAEALWRLKAAAEQETRAANLPEAVALAARFLADSDTLFVAGGDGDVRRGFAVRMTRLGLRCLDIGDWAALAAHVAHARTRDTLLLLGDPRRPEGRAAGRTIRDAGGRVVVVARVGDGPPPSWPDAWLGVVVPEAAAHVEDLVHDAVLRHVLDDLFLRVLATRPDAAATFRGNPGQANA